MADLSKEDVKALGRAVGLDIDDPDLDEVTHVFNAMMGALDEADPDGLAQVEPLPLPPPR